MWHLERRRAKFVVDVGLPTCDSGSRSDSDRCSSRMWW